MLSETLIDQTLSRFPNYDRARIKIQPLEKGGSDRKYYRIQVGGADSLILVKYGDQREEEPALRLNRAIPRRARDQGAAHLFS